MQGETGNLTDREQQLQEVVLEYLHAVDSGCAPTPKEVVTRHPDLAAELTAFFADQEGLGPLLSPLRRLTAAPAPVPTRLDDYEILDEIGRGGMGVVYRARQVSLNRLVAVKLLRNRALASPAELDRFRREAESAAHLDHPHIAPIYEVGEHEGQLYFSMKLIDGGSLARMVATVARAVHHAHQRGVLHRDLKPSNILLDAQGVPYVTDFGLAKRLEGDGRLTHSGVIVGTPEYLAPEQAQAGKRLTIAADVYGLGVVLYELLTGRVPFRGDDVLQTLQQVVEQEPTPVRRLAPEVDRDLETVCLKCLAKDPERRYGSAEMLAEDLERWLAGMPIAARPVGRLERTWRWCRRKPAQAGLAAALLLLVVVMVVAPTVSLILLRAEQQRTMDALNDEARRRQQARQALDLLSKSVIEEWLGKQPELLPQHKEFLDQALVIYREFAADTATDEASRAGLASAYHQVGNIQRILGRLPEAEEAYDRGAELYTQLSAEAPDRLEHRKELGQLLTNRVSLLTTTGRGTQAAAVLRDLVRLQRQLAADSAGPDFRVELAMSLSNLGLLAYKQHNLPAAEAAALEAVTHFEDLFAEHPTRSGVYYGRAKSWSVLGNVLADTGRPAEAERAYRAALKWLGQIPPGASYDVEVRRVVCHTHTNLAHLLKRTRRVKEAEAAYGEAIAVGRQLAADFKAHFALQGDLARAYADLGNMLVAQDRDKDAEEPLRHAITLYEKLAAASPKDLDYLFGVAYATYNLATVLRNSATPHAAEPLLRTAVRHYRALVEAAPEVSAYGENYAGALINLGICHYDRGEWAAARRLFEEALPHSRAGVRANPDQSPSLWRLCVNLHNLANTYRAEKDHAGLAAAAAQHAEAAAAAGFPSELARAASNFAYCAALAEKDAQLADARRAELAQSYAERAMPPLRLAVKYGYKNVAALKQPSFASLHSRPDFQELVAGLEKMQKKP